MPQVSQEYGYTTTLATISEGKVPKRRMENPAAVQAFVQRLWNNDSLRAKKRAKVRGLVDGNPPYNQQKLAEANRKDAANVNWGTARTYCESGSGAFYDLASEAPGSVVIQTSHGPADKRSEWSRIMSAEADRIFAQDSDWEFDIQNSINEMTLFGLGPFMFEDCFKVLPISTACADLKVPEMARATTSRWEVASVDVTYYPPQLYDFIKDEEAATKAGWNVPFVKKVIEHAIDMRDPNGRSYAWEWYQQRLKNNAIEFLNDSKVCKLAFVFMKEFDGRITQVIVERFNNTDLETEFLFEHVGWYGSFQECIHPMYFDRGNGGYHHSVTGLGVKMYGAMEYENRLLCNLMDKAFSPKIFFTTKTADSKEKLQMQRFGDYGVLPAGTEALQNPVNGYLQDGLAMFHASNQLMTSNLSAYRQQVPVKTGNPITARQAMMEASQQASLSKTTFNRFYRQLDMLYTEVVRRLCNLNSPDERAKEFQKRCLDAGVDRACFGRIESVRAARVVGQGSPMLRQDAILSIQHVVPGLPEDGRDRWTDDLIATTCGSAAVQRYNPKQAAKLATDQQAEALQWVAAMKVGVPPVVTSSQNAVVYATTFLNAASQSLQSLQQGGDPHSVLAFLQIDGPAIMAHLKRFEGNGVLKPIHDALLKQWEALAQTTDKIQAQVQKMVQNAQQQQQKTQAAMTDEQIKTAKLQGDESRKNAKLQAQLKTQEVKAKQSLALQDASTASQIQRENARHLASLKQENERHVHEMSLAERETQAKEESATPSAE